jgi:hypothetical protein
MTDAVTTVVTFQSDLFNKTESRDYFINPDCFGDDVCLFLVTSLRAAGVDCDDPAQEDWGWYFRFHTGDVAHKFACSLRRDWPSPNSNEGQSDQAWIGFLEPEQGRLALFGIGKKAVQIEAVRKIHTALTSASGITAVLWHKASDFDKGNEDLGLSCPA